MRALAPLPVPAFAALDLPGHRHNALPARAGSDHAPHPDQPLRILHAVRAPVGGIFRHILDLANGQADRGHQVGIIADSLTGGERADSGAEQRSPRASSSACIASPSAANRGPTDLLVWLRFARLIRRAEARCAAWPRRQGRRLRPAEGALQTTPSASTRRMAARCTTRSTR